MRKIDQLIGAVISSEKELQTWNTGRLVLVRPTEVIGAKIWIKGAYFSLQEGAQLRDELVDLFGIL